ncbi:MAG: carboxypeptidase regulatory-like domain-containing protein [Terriglobia bacterium]|jgi:hypothetical protein
MTSVKSATRISILVMLVLSLRGSSAFAQFSSPYSSGIEGTVVDPSGALIPGATVTITDTRLGVVKTTTTNQAGYFRIDTIAASTYTVQIQVTAFKTWVQKGLTLQVGEIRTLAPVLQVGAVSTNVTVTALQQSVDLVSAKTGATIAESTVSEIPLAGQNIFGLVALAPGITGAGGGTTSYDNYTNEYAININAAGLRQEQNGYMIDGAYTDTPSRGGGTSISPNPEIVQSINVLTNNFDAAKGRNAGATVQVFTNSGSNQLHGTVDYYFLNNSLSARTEFESTVPTFKRSEYSATLGGPIIKNKLFFFGAIDVLRSSSAQSYQATVETQDFDTWAKTNLPNSLGTQVLETAPPQSFPTTGFVTVGQITGSYYPLPTGIPATLNALGTANISFTIPKNGYQWSFRVDDYLTKKDRLYVDAMRTADTSQQTTTARPAMNNPQFNYSDFVNFDWTHTFSSHLLNEAGASMIRPYGQYSGLPAFQIPYINVIGMGGFVSWGPGNFTQTTVGWRDIMTDMVRTHTLKFGFEQYNIREADEQQMGGGARPWYNFNSLLDFVQGLPFSESGTPVNLATHQQAAFAYYRRALYTGLFLQDDWKVKPTFTLNLGVRYDAMAHLFSIEGPPLTNFTFGQGATLDERIANGVVALTPHDYFVDHNPWYITPRVGFAWDVFGNGRTAVRGGFGLFADQPPFIDMTSQTGNPPLIFLPSVSVQYGQTPVFQFCSPPSGWHETCPVVNTSNVTVNSSGGVLVNGVIQPSTVYGFSPGITMTQVEDWTLSVQRQLQNNLILEVYYLGSAAHHLPIMLYSNINTYAGDLIVNGGTWKGLNRNFGPIEYGTTDGNSIGNYGSVSLTRRTSHGLGVRGVYTYGKALDTFSSSGSLDTGSITTTTPVIQEFDLNAQRGRADFDIRQQFSADGTWTVPNPWTSHLARNVLGGWQFGGVWILQTGLPFTVYTSAPFQPVFNSSGNVIGNTGGDYNADGVDYDVPNAPSFGNHLSGQHKKNFLNGLFAASAFPAPALGQEGNLGRNTYNQPGYNNLNFTFEKFFSVPWFSGEKLRLEARGEVFNLFNRVNLTGVNSDLSSGLFGHSTNQLPPRSLQIHIRAIF